MSKLAKRDFVEVIPCPVCWAPGTVSQHAGRTGSVQRLQPQSVSTRGGQVPYRDFSHSQSRKSILHSGSELSSGHQTISNTLHVSVCRAGGRGGGAGVCFVLWWSRARTIHNLYTARISPPCIYIARTGPPRVYISIYCAHTTIMYIERK